MLRFETSVSGSQVGSELMRDTEEMAYALQAMAEESDTHTLRQIALLVPGEEAENICDFLQDLINAIKKENPS